MHEVRSRRLLQQATVLVQCTHPAASFTITLGVTLLAVRVGVGLRTLVLAPAVLLGQFSLGWTNDWLDRERDALAGRRDKPLAAGRVAARTVAAAAGMGSVMALLLTLPLGVLPFAAHLLGLILGQLHNFATRRLPISVVPFGLGFALLPVFVGAAARPPHLPAPWLLVAAVAIGMGGHFSNALRDFDSDLVVGIGGLPQVVGARASALLSGGLMLAAALMVAYFGRHAGAWSPPALALGVVAVVLAAGITLAGLRDQRLLAYRLTLAAGLVAVLALFGGGGGFA